MNKHMWLMMIACLVPLLIIIFLPFFGITGKWNVIVAIALMVIIHLWMMKEPFHSKGKNYEKLI